MHHQIHDQLQTGAQSVEARKKRSESIKKVHEEAKKTKQGQLRYYHNSLEELEAKQQKKLAEEQRKSQRIAEINSLFNIDLLSCPKPLQRRYLSLYANYKAGRHIKFNLDEYTAKEKKELEIQFSREASAYYGVDYDLLTPHERHGYVIKYLNDTFEGYKQNISNKVSQNHKLGKYKKAKIALQEANQRSHEKALEKYHKSQYYQEILELNKLFDVDYEQLPQNQKISFMHRYHNLKKKNIVNHKIIGIQPLDDVADVYDIEVQDNHNFALASGVFVHNSKDQADAVCGSLYLASLHADEFAYDYGEQSEQVLRINTGSTLDDAQQLTLNLEEELKHFGNVLRKPPPKLLSNSQEGTDDYYLHYDDIVIL